MKVMVDGWLLLQQGHGMATFARTLVAGLAGSAWRERVVVAVPAGSESVVPAGLEVRLLGGAWPAGGVLGEVLWQQRLGRLVSTRYPEDVLLALSLFWSAARPARSVVVCHDVIPVRFPRYLGRYLYRRWLFNARLRWLCEATCVIGDSVFTVEEVRQQLGADAPPLVPVPLWTPLADAPPPSPDARRLVRQKHRLPERYWLYLGGYDYRKNVELLIEAYAAASRSGECPDLVLAGPIPRDLRKPVCDVHGAMRRAGVPPARVHLPGYVDDGDLAALYAGAELFIYPSLAEGFGLPPVEAMSCGCPTIVADATSLPEVVTDPAYRFAARDPAGLAGMLESAARTPLAPNPGFDRSFYGLSRGLTDYLRVLDRVVA